VESFFWVVKKRAAARPSLLSGLVVRGHVRDGQGLPHSEELGCVLAVNLGGAGGTAAARMGSRRRRPMVARTEMRGVVKRSWRSSKASWEASKVLKTGLLRRAIVSAICMYTYLYILSRQQ
jgi:hypothetical protein